MGKNKLVIHCCGGGGINIGYFLKESKLPLGGLGFSEIELRYLDTSESNISKDEKAGSFWKVECDDMGYKSRDGSGSLRISNARVIETSMEKYVKSNEKLMNEDSIGVYHLVIFTASGGTGSVIGPKLLHKLLRIKVPASALIIGDNSSDVFVTNTIKTVAGLDQLLRNSKNIDNETMTASVFYLNNSDTVSFDDSDPRELTIHEKVKRCNEVILNIVAQLSIILSGDHKNLDFQDLNNIFNIRRLDKQISPGLYGLMTSIGINSVFIPDQTTLLAMVSLTTEESGDNQQLKLLHYKSGDFVHFEDVKDELARRGCNITVKTPMRIALFSNYFTDTIDKLAQVKSEYRDKISKVNNESLTDRLSGALGSDLNIGDDGLTY